LLIRCGLMVDGRWAMDARQVKEELVHDGRSTGRIYVKGADREKDAEKIC
jgi:hypothetical protein